MPTIITRRMTASDADAASQLFNSTAKEQGRCQSGARELPAEGILRLSGMDDRCVVVAEQGGLVVALACACIGDRAMTVGIAAATSRDGFLAILSRIAHEGIRAGIATHEAKIKSADTIEFQWLDGIDGYGRVIEGESVLVTGNNREIAESIATQLEVRHE